MDNQELMARGMLTKLKGGNADREYRTGIFYNTPVVGNPFVFFSNPLPGETDASMIATSNVTNIETMIANQVIVFTTENSKYRLDYVITEAIKSCSG